MFHGYRVYSYYSFDSSYGQCRCFLIDVSFHSLYETTFLLAPLMIANLVSISISIIYLVAAKTEWLSHDPMLWFTMMLMPIGPSAMKLTALADVNGSNENEKMSIAKFLCVRYKHPYVYQYLIY